MSEKLAYLEFEHFNKNNQPLLYCHRSPFLCRSQTHILFFRIFLAMFDYITGMEV